MLPESVCRCPTVSKLRTSTHDPLWGSQGSPEPGNTRPGPEGRSMKPEKQIKLETLWKIKQRKEIRCVILMSFFCLKRLPWEGAAGPGLWLATGWWQGDQGWTGHAQKLETQTERRRQPGGLCWCWRVRTPQTAHGSCRNTNTNTHLMNCDKIRWQEIWLSYFPLTKQFHCLICLYQVGCVH